MNIQNLDVYSFELLCGIRCEKVGLDSNEVVDSKEFNDINNSITRLGLDHIKPENGKKFDETNLDQLETLLLEKSIHLPNNKIFSYKKNDALNAINYLELICILSARHTYGDGFIKTKKISFYPTKAINCLEQAVSKLNLEKLGKEDLKEIMKLVKRRINKVIQFGLLPFEREAVRSHANQALKILKSYTR